MFNGAIVGWVASGWLAIKKERDLDEELEELLVEQNEKLEERKRLEEEVISLKNRRKEMKARSSNIKE